MLESFFWHSATPSQVGQGHDQHIAIAPLKQATILVTQEAPTNGAELLLGWRIARTLMGVVVCRHQRGPRLTIHVAIVMITMIRITTVEAQILRLVLKIQMMIAGIKA
ncbi:MAG: hypothetical protein EAZ42_04685 [Verrucomicrobia bacterium]|nr:MAG: hypothetical protein EAZ42_04685 [Verrucomicrobiota bacterium]